VTQPLPDLSPEQVVRLFDALLSNADALLNATAALLDAGQPGLARSLAVLGLEESGKAIAIHDRRVSIAYCDGDEPFVNDSLRKLWGSHPKKLKAVYTFLLDERYWFGTGPQADDEFVLNTIEEWSNEKNQAKQAGFYVDVDPASGAISSPQDHADQEAVAQVLARVHQIGWQLRLGEHIEAKSQANYQRAALPASEDDVEAARVFWVEAGLPEDEVTALADSMRTGTADALHNDAYRYHLPPAGSNPFENVGKPGYEAQDREL
jgi:AbiV family abortive infection protein